MRHDRVCKVGSVIHGVDIKLSPPNRDLGAMVFQWVGRHSRVRRPCVDEKEVGLPAAVRVTLSSIEVFRVMAWGPGHLQSSAASPRGSWSQAGLENCSCLGPGGGVRILGGFGQIFHHPTDLAGRWAWRALALGMSRSSDLLCHIWNRAQVAYFLC